MTTNQEKTLLTIAIPTFNRATCLDLCLAQLCGQTDRIGKDVELIISDNASADETPEIVAKYRDLIPITYIRNTDNIGPDANFAQCFLLASGKYVMLLADDDLFVDGAVNNILVALNSGEFGVVHLKSYSFVSDFRSEGPASKKCPGSFTTYANKQQFVQRVNIMLTFISGNIVNKKLMDDDIDIKSFCDTNLVQMSWTLSALVNADKNLYINDICIAAKAENTGGYRLCNVFGVNMRSILSRFEQRGVPPHLFSGIITTLLCDFLPGYILKLRCDTKGFQAEDYFGTLAPVYRNNIQFWIVTVPAIKLPLTIAKVWLKIVKKSMKLTRLLRG